MDRNVHVQWKQNKEAMQLAADFKYRASSNVHQGQGIHRRLLAYENENISSFTTRKWLSYDDIYRSRWLWV